MTRPLNINISDPYRQYQITRSGKNSPRVDGKLVLQENPFNYQRKAWYSSGSSVQFLNRHPNDIYIKQDTFLDRAFNDGSPATVSVPTESLVNKLRNKIREGDFNAPVALAERKSTFDMILGTASKIAGAARSVKKGKFRKACSQLGCKYKNPKDLKGALTPANYWLEIQYGWKPLYQDIYNGMVATDQAQQRAENRKRRVSVYQKGELSDTGKASTAIGIPWGAGQAYIYVPTSGQISGIFKQKLSAIVECENPTLATVDSLGILNPALVAWELVPFSFVFDWFLPVGDWIAATTPLWGYKLISCFQTVFVDTLSTTNGGNVRNGSKGSAYVEGGKQYSYTLRYNANVSNSGKKERVIVTRSSASLSPTLPQFDFTGSVNKTLTSVSLLLQQLSNLRK